MAHIFRIYSADRVFFTGNQESCCQLIFGQQPGDWNCEYAFNFGVIYIFFFKCAAIFFKQTKLLLIMCEHVCVNIHMYMYICAYVHKLCMQGSALIGTSFTTSLFFG